MSQIFQVHFLLLLLLKSYLLSILFHLNSNRNFLIFLGHSGPITAISFSENGYYLATAAEDCCVRLWDLRKLKNFKTLPLEEGYEIRDLCFDQSGTYLAVAGTDVR